jgi:methyl-accepting chemotaxis protein
MWGDFFSSLSLIDLSGYLIIAVILLTLVIAVIANLATRQRYAAIERDLRRHSLSGAPFRHRVLIKIVRDAEKTFGAPAAETGFQALIEHHVSRELKGALMAERFLKSASGLMIVLGLVGTFYGLTLSIGKLVTLITGNASGIAEITESLTKGLAGALSGMSVAFSTSLFGIVAAIAVMLLGVFSNLTDRRSALVLRLEVYLDDLKRAASGGAEAKAGVADSETAALAVGTRVADAIADLGTTVTRFQESIAAFDESLAMFSKNTRDFQEFNLHLKDNIQRMSLGFADLSETLKSQVALLTSDRER